MELSKKLAPGALAAVAVIALVGASTAGATTLEVGGVKKNESVNVTISLKTGTSAFLKDTSGFTQNTCTGTHVIGHTVSPYTGATVTAEGDSLVNSGCLRTITVDDPGNLKLKWIPGTTNGTVESEEAVLTTGSPIGTLTCKTNTGTHIGTFTGVASGTATMHVNGIINCGLIPSARWEGTYTVTTPTGLGVTE